MRSFYRTGASPDLCNKARRILKLGDSIAIGERLLVADGAYIEVQGNNGNILRVADERNILFTEEVFLATEDPTTTTIAPLSNDTNAVLAALAQGQDPLQDLEATAAGLNAGAADDGGISFVRIARVAETIQGLTLSSESPLSLGSTLVVVDDDALPDTTPPALTVALDPASDSGTKGDGITNDNTPTISGTGSAGDTITITTPTGESITTTVKPDGTWTATPTQPLPDGNNTISVKATDPAGNSSTSSVPVTVDSTPPAVTAKLDPSSDSGTPGDGITNDNTPTISGTGEPGNTITVTTPVGETLTTTVKPDGTWSVTPTQPLPDGAANFPVTATDPAGNSTSSSVPVTIDSAVPNASAAPTVTITEDANNDGFINASESQGPVDLKVAFDPSKVEVGDTVKVTANGVTQDVVISAADKANGYVTATTPLPAQDTMLNVSAVIVDAAGNSSVPGTDSAKVDRSDLSGVSVSITEDANNDGVINQSELQGSVGVTVTLPAGAIAGDLLTVSANGNATQAITLTPAQIAAGQVIVELQAPASGSTLTVSAQVTDAAGNQSNVASDSARIDTTAPALTAKLDPASDSGTQGDGITNDNTPTLSGTGEPGNTITVTSPTGEVLTTTVKPDGTWSVTPTQPLPDGVANFPVTATDPAGNTTSSSVPVTIDTTPPAASITLNSITADNVINATEAGQQIPVTGSVGGDAKAGDTVTLTVNGKTFTGTVAADKTFSINVPGSDLLADPDTTVDASITTTDAAGNSTTVSDSEDYSLGTPPTLTAQLDPASDSGKQGDGITSDSTPTISGTTTPGASVSVSSPTGEVLTTTAGPDGKWSVTPTQPLPNGAANFPVTATSPAGDVTSTTVPVTIDTTAPTLTAVLDPSSDSGTQGDGLTNDNTPTLSGTGEPGNTITVTTPVGETLTTTVKPDGTWSVTPTQPLPDGAANFPVTATDPAGNSTSSSVPVTIDTAVPNAGAAPTVTITEDANNDGYINASEASGPVDLKVAFDPNTVAVGDTVKVTANGVTQDVVISAADKANGYVTATTPLPANGSTLDVSAVIVDAAGNSSLPGSDSAIVDTTALSGLGIQILEDENNDGYIVSSELKDNDIDVRVTLPADAAVGDTLTVSGSGNTHQVFTLTATQLAAGFIDVSFNPTADRTTFVASAQLTDAAGNQGGPVQDSATIVVGAPGAPIVVIGEDANNDGYINAAELQGPINASVILPATAKAGDTLQTSVNSVAQAPIVLTAADISNGSVTLPGIANPGEGQTLTVTAQVSNPAGIAGASGSDSAIIDTTPPAASVTLNANITPDDVINAAESKQDIAITGSVGGDVKAGDTVTLTVNGKTFTGTVAADKTFSIPVSGADLVADSDKTIDASVTTTDAAGNSTTATASEGYSVDTTAPTLTAQLDPASDSGTPGDGITNDNTPTLSGTGEPGNTITVTTPVGETLTTTVKPDGSWSVTPTQPLPDGAANFPVTATDPAGNSTSSSVPVTIDSAVPNAGAAPTVTITDDVNDDGYINMSEIKGDATIKVAFDPSKVAVGDTVRITANGGTQDVVISAADKANGYVTTTTPTAPSGSTQNYAVLNVSAVIVDAAGNSSAPGIDSAQIDLAAPAASVTLNANITPDDVINAAESKQDIAITGSVGGDVKVGDTVTLTVNGKTFNGTVAADKTFSIPVPGADLVADSDKTIDASVTTTDAAGNSTTATASEGYSVDTTAPTLTAKLDPASDSGTQGDGITNDNTPTISGTGEPGNTITVTSPTGEVLTTTVKPDGTWSVTPTQPLPDGAANFPVTATDPAGNSTSSSVPVTIDTTAPTLTAVLDPASDSGKAGDGITSDTTPTISGTGEPGNSIQVTMPGTGEVLTTTVGPDGKWSVTPTQALPEGGPQTVSVLETDPAGVTSTATVPVTIDTTPPLITVSAPDNSNDSTPTITGTSNVPAGTVVTLVVTDSAGTVQTLSATVQAGGSYSVDVPVAMPDGNFTVSASVVDPAGNPASASDNGSLDALAGAITVQATVDNANRQLDISGSTVDVAPGQQVALKIQDQSGHVINTTAIVQPDGSYSLQDVDVSSLQDGTLTTTASAIDRNGATRVANDLDQLDVFNTAPVNTVPGAQSLLEDGSRVISGLAISDPDAGSGYLTVTLNVSNGVLNVLAGPAVISGSGTGSVVLSGTVAMINATLAAAGAVTYVPAANYNGSDSLTMTTLDNGNTGLGGPLSDTDTVAITVTSVNDAPNGADKTIQLSEGGIYTFKLSDFGFTDPNDTPANGFLNVTINTIPVNGTLFLDSDGDGMYSSGEELPAGQLVAASSINSGELKYYSALGNTKDDTFDFSVRDNGGTANGGKNTDPVPNRFTMDVVPLPVVTVNAPDNTNDSTPTLGGTSNQPAGSIVTITVTDSTGAVQTLSATVQTNGTYSVDVPSALAQGAYTAVASSANVLGDSTTASDNGSVDSIPPVLTAKLDPSSDSGTVGDGVTNDNTPTISGTGEPGSTIQVTMPGTNEVLITTVGPDGKWSVTPTQALPEGGPQTVAVKETDSAGNSTNATVPITVDTLPPPLVAKLDPASDSGVVGDGITNDNTPTISGSGTPGDTITVTMPTGEVLTTTVKPDGSWSVTPTQALPDGAISIPVTATDPAGNTTSSSVPVTIDTTPPVPTITLNPNVTADDIINASEATQPVPVTGSVGGDAKAGDIVTLTVNGKTFTGTVQADKTFSINVPGSDLVADTGKTITASVTTTDAAGNPGSASTSDSYNVDTTAPNSSTTSITVDNVTADNVINTAEATQSIPVSGKVTGEFKAGDVVTLLVNGSSYQTTIDAAGNYSVNVAGSDLKADTTIDATVAAHDAAGNVGDVSTVHSHSVDTTPPAVTAQLDPASDSGTPGDGITNDNTPTISGTGEPGNTITVTSPTGEVMTTTVKPDGTWSVTPTQPLPDGAANFPVTATDPAGNSTSSSVPVTIDTAVPNAGAAPTVTITEDANNDGYINASEASGPVDLKVAFDPNTVAVGDTVKVTANGVTQDVVITAADKANGYVTATTPLPANGSTLDVSAVIVDAAGNSSLPGSDSAIVDTQGPGVVADTRSGNEDTIITGNVLANDMGGAGETVTVQSFSLDGGATTHLPGATVVIAGTGTFSLAADGAYTFTPVLHWSSTVPAVTYTATDGHGNSASTTLQMTVVAVADKPDLTIISKDKTQLFTASSWETVLNVDALSTTYIDTNSLDGWTRVDDPQQTGGINSFEVWSTGDMMQNQAGKSIAVQAAPGAGNNFIELNDSTHPQLAQTIGITRTFATTAGELYQLDFAAAGRLGFTADFTRLGIYVDGVLYQTLELTSPQDYLDWQNVKISIAGDGNNHMLTLRTDATAFNPGGRGVLLDVLGMTSSTGVIAGNNVVDTKVHLADYISGALVDTDGSESLSYTFGNLPAGSTIVTSSGTYTPSSGVVTIPASELASANLHLPSSYTGTLPLSVTDTATEASNGSTASNSGVLKLEVQPSVVVTATPAPTITILSDTNNDAFLNTQEVGSSGTVAVRVALPAAAKVGDTITVTDNNPGSTPQQRVLTADDIAAGYWDSTVARPAEGSRLVVTASRTDLDGKVSPSSSDYATLDTTAPTVTAVLASASDSGTKGDGITNDNTPTISGTGNAGDKITVTTPTGEVLTATVQANGTWSVTPTQALPDGAANFPVTATDPAGNTASTSVLVTIDTTPPVPSITLNPNVTADDIINSAEAALTIPVSGTVGGDAKQGDTVTLTVNGKTFSGTVAADNTFSINVPGSDLAADSDKTIDAQVSTTDAAGNVGTATAKDSYTVQTSTAPVANPDSASVVEAGGTVGGANYFAGTPTATGNVLANDTDLDAGDTKTLTVVNGQAISGSTVINGVYGTLTVATDGSYSYALDNTKTATNLLAKGAVVNEVFNYTMQDGKGLSSSSQLTVQVSGTNDAPTFTSLQPMENLFPTVASSYGNLIDITAINGTPGLGTAPSGWRTTTNTPDTTAYTPDSVSSYAGIATTVLKFYGVSGNSMDGGTALNMVARASDGWTEAVSTDLNGLTIGRTYTIGVQWQKSIIETVSNGELQIGGALRISSSTGEAITYSKTETAQNDKWDLAYLTFVAKSTSTTITLRSAVESGWPATSIQSVISDSLNAANLQTLIATPNATGAKLSELMSDAVAIDSGDSIKGYAITSAAQTSAGYWEYNNGSSWVNLGALGASAQNAVFLTADTALRWNGASTSTALSMVAVDTTDTQFTGVGSVGDVSVNGGSTAYSAPVTLAATRYGTSQTDNLVGDASNNQLLGLAGNDALNGGLGDDYLDGGKGADTLIGGTGKDTFVWHFGDGGSPGTPVRDTINDFNRSEGDVLDLRDLLKNESASNLTQYLHFTASGSDTLVQVSSLGSFNGSNYATVVDQEILLKGVALSSLGSTDTAIINELLKNNLKVDGM